MLVTCHGSVLMLTRAWVLQHKGAAAQKVQLQVGFTPGRSRKGELTPADADTCKYARYVVLVRAALPPRGVRYGFAPAHRR